MSSDAQPAHEEPQTRFVTWTDLRSLLGSREPEDEEHDYLGGPRSPARRLYRGGRIRDPFVERFRG